MGDSILVDLDKSLGWYPTDVRASKDQRPVKKKKAKTTDVKKLRPDSKGVTCLVKMVEDPKQVEGSNFWEAMCGDESAQIVLSMAEAQKAVAAKDTVLFARNASVKMIKGHMRLVVDKWGKLDASTEGFGVESIGADNMSNQEYE